MSSQVEIFNYSATLLGQGLLNGPNDTGNVARRLRGVYDLERRKELRLNIWKFAKRRLTLPALATAPLSGPYNQAYEVPAGYLRMLMIGTQWASVDLSDYRSGPTSDDWSIENGQILTNWPAPLAFMGTLDVTDASSFDDAFAVMLACRLATTICYAITNSTALVQGIKQEYVQARRDALRAGAMETPPTMPADDTWISARYSDGGGSPWTAD